MSESEVRSATGQWLARLAAGGRLAEWRAILLVLLLQLVVWTAYAALSKANLDGPGDMIENYVQGLDLQFGYGSHPPFHSWLVGLWFRIFPSTDLAYHLLAATNIVVALGLAGALAARILPPPGALVAVLMLSLVPYYNVSALTYNANSALLPLWPAAALALHRMLATRRIVDGVLLGVACAAAMLTKYFSACLLVALGVAALADPRRAVVWRSAAPYAAAVTVVLLCLPHLLWLVDNDFAPVAYAEGRRVAGWGELAPRLWLYVAGQAAVLALPVALFFLAARTAAAAPFAPEQGDRRFLWIVTVLPFAVSVVLGVASFAPLASTWAMPAWFALPPILFVVARRAPDLAVLRAFALAVAIALVLAVIAAPIVDQVLARRGALVAVDPRRELAERIPDLWRREFGRPLAVVAGDRALAGSITFYAPEHPRYLTGFAIARGATVGPEGIAVICPADDAPCRAQAEAFVAGRAAMREIGVAQRRAWIAVPERGFAVWFVPPR